MWNRREWIGFEGTFPRLSGPILCPRQGHHSSPLFSKPPVKLVPPPLRALTVATADPETSTCSMAQTRSSSPRRSCPLPPGQQSFAGFKPFAGYQRARKGRVTSGSEQASGCPLERVRCDLSVLEWKARLLLSVRSTQYILLPTYKKMFITCNCTEVCASQQR